MTATTIVMLETAMTFPKESHPLKDLVDEVEAGVDEDVEVASLVITFTIQSR